MSRIIKFRAWDVEDKQMIDIGEPAGIEWAHGRGVKLIFGEAFHDDYSDGGIIHYELMQFTGLLDKNGKEIYEGDILAMEGTTAKVVFWERPPTFGLDPIDEDAWCDDWNLSDDSDRMEVIGNLYEIPEQGA